MKRLAICVVLLGAIFLVSCATGKDGKDKDAAAPAESGGNAEPAAMMETEAMQPAATVAPAPSAPPVNCYDIGYRWGICAGQATASGTCDPATEVKIPQDCTDREETQLGIKDGLRTIQGRMQRGY